MLESAHKALLLELARGHERDLRSSLSLARQHFGETHMTVRTLVRRVELVQDTVRTLETEPARAAA